MTLDAAAVAISDSSSSGATSASTPPRLEVELSEVNVQIVPIPEQSGLTDNPLVLTNQTLPAYSYADLVFQDESVLTRDDPNVSVRFQAYPRADVR